MNSWNLHADELLNRLETVHKTLAGKGDCTPLLPGASGAANSVDVALGVLREIVVENEIEVVDVQTAGGNIRRDEEIRLSFLQVLDDPESLLLRQVANDVLRLVSVFTKAVGKLLAHCLRIREDQSRVRLLLAQKPKEKTELLVLGNVKDLLLHRIHGHTLGIDLDLHRVVHVLPRDVQDPRAQGSAVEHGDPLFFRRQLAEDFANVRVEAHVEEPIRLVNDGNPEHAEVELFRLIEVEETARRRNNQVDALLERVLLRFVTDPPVDADHAKIQMLAKHLRIALDLDCQLASRSHY